MRGESVAIPGDYSTPIAVMRYMDWSWPAYCAAPEDLVNEIVMQMDREAHWAAEKRKLDASQAAQKARARGR